MPYIPLMKLFLFAFLILLSGCKETQADADVGLYDPIAPAGSAFVRFINLEEGNVVPIADSKKYDPLKRNEVSAYFVVKQGSRNIELGSKKTNFDFTEGEFYSVINLDNVSIIQDSGNTDRSKATIALYNFSDMDAVSLKAKGGTVDVLTDVVTKGTKARDMNALKIDFGVYQGSEIRANLDEVVLERGNHYSVIFNGKAAKMVTATTNTRK